MGINKNRSIILKSEKIIDDMAVSFDGHFLAVSTGDILYIIDLKSGELIHKISVEKDFQEIENLHFDKIGRLYIDHRSHFVIWDQASFFTPEFQKDHLRGFCFLNSRKTGEHLLYHPAENKLFITDPELNNCKEIIRLNFGKDFTEIEARFLFHDKLIIWIENYYKIFTLPKEDDILQLNEFQDWFEGCISDTYENMLALKS